MELMLEQMPIVIRSLNVGFLQTLKLFAVTLLGRFLWGLSSHSAPCRVFGRSAM